MRNRAKCKLCGDILESFHKFDYVSCKCGEIAIEGGQAHLRAFAKNWENFLRIDDKDILTEIKVIEKEEGKPKISVSELKPTKKELIEQLNYFIKNAENLPQHAMTLPINHYDFYAFAILMYEILADDHKNS